MINKRQPARRLARRLGWLLAGRAGLYVTLSLSPFFYFLVCAHPSVAAGGRVFIACVAALLMAGLTWDYVAGATRRGEEAFTLGWLPALGAHPVLKLTGMQIGAAAFAVLFGFTLSAIMQANAVYVIVLITFPLMLTQTLRLFLEGRVDRSSEIADAAARGDRALDRLRQGRVKRAAMTFGIWGIVMPVIVAALSIFVIGSLPWPASDEANAYFKHEANPEREDGFYAVLGIVAPPGTEDFAGWGRDRATREMAGEHPPPLPASEDMIKGLPENLGTGAPRPCAREQEEGCLPLKRWDGALAANEELLKRFEALGDYNGFDMPLGMASHEYPGAQLMRLGALHNIACAYQAQAGDAEGALKRHLATGRVIAKMLASRQFLVTFAIGMSLYGDYLETLPYILSLKPALAAQYHDEIAQTLVFLDPGFDYKPLWQADGQLQMQMVRDRKGAWVEPGQDGGGLRGYLHDTFIRNTGFFNLLAQRDYEMSRDVGEAMANKDYRVRHDALNAVRAKYDVSGGDLPPALRPPLLFFRHVSEAVRIYQAAFAALLTGGRVQGVALLDIDGRDVNNSRAVMAIVDGMAAGAWPKGMEDLLKQQADKGRGDIIAGRPLDWNAGPEEVCYLPPGSDYDRCFGTGKFGK